MRKRYLLDNISEESLRWMLPCFKPMVKVFGKGEQILSYEEGEPDSIAVLLKGRASLEIVDDEGNSYLLENYEEGDIFGELFTLPLQSDNYVVTARENVQVVFIDYQHIISPCEKSCAHHTQLISNLFIMTAQRTQELALHLSLLGQPTTRDKLLCFLRFARTRAGAAGSEVFQIPMTLSQLADYLFVDRSAMSREIKAMSKEGLLEASRRLFRLL